LSETVNAMDNQRLAELRASVAKLNDEAKSPFDERVQDILERIVEELERQAAATVQRY